jgi:3',5'-cyclic AMP phosphodiesterase CpdA
MIRAAAVLLLAVSGAGPRCTERVPDPPRGELRVVVISDLNSAYGSTEYEPRVHQAVELIRTVWRPDLVLAAGDLVAGQRTSLTDAQVRAMWTAFELAVGRPLRESGIPFAPTVGNHDGSRYPAHERDRRLAREHWADAAHDPGIPFVDAADFPFNYSLRLGPLFVLVWDASNEETFRAPGISRWAEDALAARLAREAHWRMVLGHLPLYAVAEGRNRPGEVLAEADSLRELLLRHGVHTYVSGHHHAYYPGRSGELDLLHAGAIGQGPRPLIGGAAPAYPSITILDLWPASDSIAYTTYRVEENGAMRLVEVPLHTLPERLDGFNGTVWRRDVR